MKEVSVESAREKNIRHGHISTLHIWWARRPLASSRATAYAALIPPPKDTEDWNKTRNFIAEFSKWENSLNQTMIQKARADILKANGGKPPRVLDPFGGGGAIPLEALRLGCETYSNDLNPVAVLIQKCTLEYPQKYGRLGTGYGKWGKGEKENDNQKLSGSGCLENGHGSDIQNLQANEDLPYGGEIRSDLSNTESGSVHTFKHSGGLGQGVNERIHPVSEDCQRIGVRNGNPDYDCQQDRLSERSNDAGHSSANERHRQNASLSYPLFGEEIEALSPISNPLLAAVRRWGAWVLEEARKEIGRFYPADDGGHIPVGYIWARTTPCQNPACGEAIPLMRQYWLARKDKKKVALFPYADHDHPLPCAGEGRGKGEKSAKVQFKIVGTGYEPMPAGFDPEKGSVARAVATCPVCGSMVAANTTRSLFQEGKAGDRMVAVVLHKPGQTGKRYRIATDHDMAIFREAAAQLEKKRDELMANWGMDPVPDEFIHTPDNKEYKSRGLLYNFTPVLLYGMTKWGDLFNARQKLSLITFTDKIRQAHSRMLAEGYDPDYAKAVVSYLACGISRLADQSTVLVPWITQLEAVAHTFNRQALGMVWDYIESYPFAYFLNSLDWIDRIIDHLSQAVSRSLNDLGQESSVQQASATAMPYSDNFFDAVFTDPPYYDNVPYADLSDFFYVWLKRTIGGLYPELFTTPTTPKRNEIIAELPLLRGMNKDKASFVLKEVKTQKHFEEMLKKSFREIHRVLKPDGIAVIVYAHKSTEGWETLINSLLDSNLIMTGAWPLKTEMAGRLRAQESATLSSSIYIVARKMTRQTTGFYHQVREALKEHMDKKLERLWQEGIGGADFFIAAIGSAIEVFGKYEQVMDYEGNVVRADRMLEDVRKIATEYAVRQILHNGFAGEISDLTRFYVLYRWNYGSAKILFDEAQKLARSCGIDIAREWSGGGFIRKEKEFIRVLGPEDREPDDIKHREELIDVLHRCLRLWEKGKRNDLVTFLQESVFGKSEAFFRVAQAISETLPNESKEKKLLDGFLSGRERLREEMKQALQGELL